MDVLRRHNTSIRVVISPDYNQKELHPDDREILQSILEKKMYMISVVLTSLQKIITTIMNQDTTVPC